MQKKFFKNMEEKLSNRGTDHGFESDVRDHERNHEFELD
jgi:hypothetical protein